MKLLLDTHIILWRMTDDPRLSAQAIAIMDEDKSSIDVSVISVWEVAVKWALRTKRRNDMPLSGTDFLSELSRIPIAPMTVRSEHAAAIDDLPLLHGDPFDRFLLATAKHEGMILLTHDAALAAYGDFVRVV